MSVLLSLKKNSKSESHPLPSHLIFTKIFNWKLWQIFEMKQIFNLYEKAIEKISQKKALGKCPWTLHMIFSIVIFLGFARCVKLLVCLF